MSENLELKETTVADLLKATPEAVQLFIHVHTACVGCSLGRFCTLEDVIKTYELNETAFLEELSKYRPGNH